METASYSAETSWKSIDCSSLAALVRSDQHKHLVIDCRSLFDYNASHITNALNIPCSKLLRRRLQHNSANIMELLSRHNSDLDDLDSDVIVTVYDQSTAAPATLCSDSFLVILLDRLANNFKHVSGLTGGFAEFRQSYSALCVSSSSSSSCSSSSSISCFEPHPMHHSSLSQPCMPVCNVGPTRILPFLFLGSQLDALSHETITQNGITYVINVSVSGPKPSYISESNFLRIPINDNYSEKLTPYFSLAFQFLDKVREANGCVLIHCLAGISRSPTLAIAYVMKVLDFNTDEAYRYVKDKRPTISPNFNFLGQLLEFEQSSLNASTRCSGRMENSHTQNNFPAKKQRMAVDNSRNSLNFQLVAPSSAASSNICSPTTALSLLNFSQLSPLQEHQTPPSDPLQSSPQLTGSSIDGDDVRPGNTEIVIRLGSKHCAIKRPLGSPSTEGVSAGGSESFNCKSSLPRPQSIFLSAKTDSVSVVSPVMSQPNVPNNSLVVDDAGSSSLSSPLIPSSQVSRSFRNILPINREERMTAACRSFTLPCSSGVNLRDLPRVTGGDHYSLPCPSGGDIPVYRCHEASTVESHVGVSASSSHSSLLMDSPEVIRVS